MKKMFINLGLLSFIVFQLTGCTTVSVEPMSLIQPNSLNREWNDYDAMATSQELVYECLRLRWRDDFIKEQGRNPRIMVGPVMNDTPDAIGSESFLKYLEREVMDSGKVVFIAVSDEQRQANSSLEAMMLLARELGGDYILVSRLNAVHDIVPGKRVSNYQVTLELIDVTLNEKVWTGQKDIKKIIRKN